MINCLLTCCSLPFCSPHTSFRYIFSYLLLNWLGQVNFRTISQLVVVVVVVLLVNYMQMLLSDMAHLSWANNKFPQRCQLFFIVVLSWYDKQKYFYGFFQNKKKTEKSEKNISQWKAKKIVPRPACQTPATLSQEFSFPLAMLSFVICVFHENMRCIRSYIVSLSIYVCTYVYIGTLLSIL